MFDQQEITKIVQVLESGGIIVHQTDTIWGVAADAFNVEAVKKIFSLKERPFDKKLILLVDSSRKVREYVSKIPVKANSILDHHVRPITIIYENAHNLPNELISADGSIAIRVVQDDFCSEIIKQLGRPIVSTSANFSGEETPVNYQDINALFLKKVDYVSTYNRNGKNKVTASTIAKISPNNELIILRK